MSASNFLACFHETESFEGGYVYDPHDPGGATLKGVTQGAYSAWLKTQDRSDAPVKSASNFDIQAIYRMEYWNAVRGNDLYDGLDLVMVDTAWGSGPVTAIQFLQRALGVADDGRFGSLTLAAVKARWNSPALIDAICAARMTFFQSLSTWRYFGVGWTKRLNGIHIEALKMNAASAAKPGESPMTEATVTTAPATPVSPARVVPTATQPVRIAWQDWLEQLLVHETPLIETAAQTGLDIGAAAVPGGIGSLLVGMLGPTIVKQAVDGVVATIGGALSNSDLTVTVPASDTIATMAVNVLNSTVPTFAAKAEGLLDGWIKSAVSAVTPK